MNDFQVCVIDLKLTLSQETELFFICVVICSKREKNKWFTLNDQEVYDMYP